MEEGIAKMIKIGLELAEKLCRTCPIRKDCRAGALYPEGGKYLCRIAGYKNEIEKIKKEMEDGYQSNRNRK